MRLTARRAVEIARELWEHLAKTGGASKASWKGWAVYGEMLCHCPLCEYVDRKQQKAPLAEDGCELCPLRGRWGEVEYCQDDGSPFEDWQDAVAIEERKVAARRMVTLFDKWLKERRRVRSPNG